MAEPAFAALRAPGEGSHCYHAQWGGSRERLAAVFDQDVRTTTVVDGEDGRPTSEVNGEDGRTVAGEGRRVDPYGPLLDCAWQYDGTLTSSLPDAVDYLRFTVVYAVTPASVAVYLPVWLGVPPVLELPPSAGVLCRVRSLSAVDQLRMRLRRRKDNLAARVSDGPLAAERVPALLTRELGGDQVYRSSACSEHFRR